MGSTEKRIECRKCREAIPLEVDSCPHCGKSTRGTLAPALVAAVGTILAISSLLDLAQLWFYGMIGVVLVVIGVFMIYDKRRRIREV